MIDKELFHLFDDLSKLSNVNKEGKIPLFYDIIKRVIGLIYLYNHLFLFFRIRKFGILDVYSVKGG